MGASDYLSTKKGKSEWLCPDKFGYAVCGTADTSAMLYTALDNNAQKNFLKQSGACEDSTRHSVPELGQPEPC